MLTSNDVYRLLKVSRATLHNWIERGAVVPTEPGGKGRGRGYTLWFAPVQAVGLAYALTLRDAGCRSDCAVVAARFVEAQTPADLRRAFAQGRTLVSVSPVPGEGRLVRPVDPDTLHNLERVYDQVVTGLREAAAEAEQEGWVEAAVRLGAAADELAGGRTPGRKEGRRVCRRPETVG